MKICVIGAGTMGAGIAQVFAAAGHDVYLCDVTRELAEKGRAGIAGGLNKLVEREKLSREAADKTLGAITCGAVDGAAGCELYIEAIVENMKIKKELFARLETLCAPDAVFASNTSSLSITELSLGSRPVVGMHFFNPAPVMALVEVIAGLATPPEAVRMVTELAQSVGKTPVQVNEAPGFVVNRILIPMINEAVFVLSEGVASAADIDTAMKLGANHPMGPLALADLIGNDIVLNIMDTLYGETGDGKYRAAPLLRKMVRGGLLGRKTKKGFFEYTR